MRRAALRHAALFTCFRYAPMLRYAIADGAARFTRFSLYADMLYA